MARSEALWIAGALVVAASCVACADLLGLGDYGSCGDACDGGADVGESGTVANGDGGADAAPLDAMTFEAGDAAPIEASLYWVRWPMPNPSEVADADGLPNASQYTLADGVVTDVLTSLQWRLETIAAGDDCAATFGPSWRLPTRIELVSLIDFARQNPAIDPVFVPDGGAVALSVTFATSSSNDAGAWVVEFMTGAVTTTAAPQRARCVSVGP